MPSPPPPEEPPPPAHLVLRGLPTDDLTRWRLELRATAAATGCLEVLFPPDETASAAPAPALSHHSPNLTGGDDGTWQHLARTLQVRSARAIVARFVSGRVWALMLANLAAGSADALAEPSRLLLARPADALRLAREAAAGLGAAPASARQRSRLLFELEHGAAGDYPSEAHHRDAVEWLEVVVHLSVDERAVRLRRAHAFSGGEEEEEEVLEEEQFERQQRRLASVMALEVQRQHKREEQEREEHERHQYRLRLEAEMQRKREQQKQQQFEREQFERAFEAHKLREREQREQEQSEREQHRLALETQRLHLAAAEAKEGRRGLRRSRAPADLDGAGSSRRVRSKQME